MKVTYPAIFKTNGDTICIHFPDLRGAVSEARQGDDPMEWAKDCLSLYLKNFAKLGWTPTKSSSMANVLHDPTTERVVLVEVDVDE